jgi:hypothetical protein
MNNGTAAMSQTWTADHTKAMDALRLPLGMPGRDARDVQEEGNRRPLAGYVRGEGHASHSDWRIDWGRNYLSQLSEETGGEAYWQGFVKLRTELHRVEPLSADRVCVVPQP